MTALTREQIALRLTGIGSSDAGKIVEGGEAWYALWMEKTGRAEPPKILSDWEAALRHCTEPLNLDWFGRQVGREITMRGERVICAEHPILQANLDGFDEGLRGPVDAKHINSWAAKGTDGTPLDWAWRKYWPQLTHQMICTATTKSALTVIVDLAEPKPIYAELDEFFAVDYIERCREFWSFVTSDKEPPGAPPAAPPPIPVDKMRVVDMTGNNSWAADAGLWLETKRHAEMFKVAADHLKTFVEADVREAFGHGIVIKRDRRGLSIKEST